MKKHWLLVLLLSTTCSSITLAQVNPPAPSSPAGEREAANLSDAQTARVRGILSSYNAAALTAGQAKSINQAFREAGLRNGPALDKALRDAGFSPERISELDPPGGGREQGAGRPPRPGQAEAGTPRQTSGERRGGPQQYSLEQAISDNAQLHTIAFSGLAFVTGDFGACTFMPPGKVCDYFGFQYMRDIDAAQKGHNPMFLDRVAGNVFKTLTVEQRAIFESAARKEAGDLRALAQNRLPLIKAFCRQLQGDIPAGSTGLDANAVTHYVGDLFAFDAQISYRRAQTFAQIASQLSSQQKQELGKMKFGDFNTWPAVEMDQYKLPRGSEKMVNVAYMTYASEFFSWYAGSVEADTYFCPERHGTYFGGFYMKDMPAMGKKNFDISTSVTGDSGRDFLTILTPEQRGPIVALPDQQRSNLKEIVDTRRAISAELRRFLSGQTPELEKVVALGRRYGELDGRMSWAYAMAFASANKTLTAEQRKSLVKLRNLDGYTSAPAYIYSDPMKESPAMLKTDAFFFAPVTP